jgi:UDP-GlcNAc:undecaprenyl-phosphate/decaprenyl-phosphate GlcNAc-1-phosphate transferase
VYFLTAISFVAALGLSWVLTYLIRGLAVRRGWTRSPASDRHIHEGSIPRIGGLALYPAIALTIAGGLLYIQHYSVTRSVNVHTALALLGAAAMICIIGLYDDLHGVGPYPKLVVQALAGGLLYLAGLRIFILPILFGNRPLGSAVSLIATVLFVIWITNAFNLIDGVDGLAAGSALFSSIAVFIISIINENAPGMFLTAVLSGALAGFLRFNFSPATIFLGDSGSLLVGFLLAGTALYGQKSSTMVAVAIPLVSCGLPVLETGVSVMRRFLSGTPLFAADRQHIHHRLLARGLSQRKTVFVLYGVSAVFAMISLLMVLRGGATQAVLLLVLGVVTWVGVQHLGYPEFFELQRIANRTMGQKLVIEHNILIRRAVDALGSCRDLGQVCLLLEAAFVANDFDGFDLSYQPSPECAYLLGRCAPMLVEGSNVSYRWSRSRTTQHLHPWQLTLPLVGKDGEARGSFTVYRYYAALDLKMDINVLVSGFPERLSMALERSFAEMAGADQAHTAAAPAGACT